MKHAAVRLAVLVAMCLVLASAPAAGAALRHAPAPSPAQASDFGPATIVGDIWDWVVIRNPSSTVDYTPATGDFKGWTNGAPVFHRNAKGNYHITYEAQVPGGPHENAGNVFVSALDSRSGVCATDDWGYNTSNGDLNVEVVCFKAGGAPRDMPFSMNFLMFSGSTGQAAYALANDPSVSDYTPDLNYQYSTATSNISVHRVKRGTWDVTMPDLGSNHGTVLVSVAQSAPRSCRVVSWGDYSGDQVVRVRCNALSGAPTDTSFAVAWLRDMGMEGPAGGAAAYAFADKPTTGSYTARARYRYTTGSSAPQVSRSGVGRYSVRLPGLANHGSAQVAAISNGFHRCNLTSIRTSGTPQTVGVICFDKSAAPADTMFTVSYAN